MLDGAGELGVLVSLRSGVLELGGCCREAGVFVRLRGWCDADH